MRIQSILTSTLLWISFFSFSCKKEKSPTDSIPQASTIGSNTIFYMLNGNQHYIQGVPGVFSDDAVSVSILSNSVFISSYNRKDSKNPYDDLNIYVNTQTPVVNKKYFLSKIFPTDEQSYYTGGQSTDIYIADSTRSYVMFTRFDATVIAGSFVFYGTRGAPEQTIELNNGWFDISRKQ